MFAPNTMQKLFFAVPAFILFAGTIFSETTFSPSLDFRSGILMYEAGRSSFFHTARFDADFDSEEIAYSLGARYLYGKFPHSVFCGNVHAGSVDFSFTRDFYSVRAGGGAFSFPDEVRVLNGKPHFILSGLSGFGVTLGGTVDFFILKKKFKLDADFFWGKSNVDSGDMYYFYGKPTEAILWGGKTMVSIPHDFELFFIGGSFSMDLDTAKNISVGEFGASVCALLVARKFELSCLDAFSIKPFFGYAYFSAFGDASLTSESQTYSFFPYKHVGGNFEGNLHFISAGNFLEFKKNGWGFSFNLIWLFCFGNSIFGEYSYQFKKNLFFDGSSDGGNLPLPDASGTHLFAGKMEVSYKFLVGKNFSPTVRVTKTVGAVVLNREVKDFLATASSSYSTVSSSSADSSTDSSSTSEILKKALLSGTSISLKINF